MPFFSFLLKDSIPLLNDFNIKPNQVYYSKSTFIWKTLNKEKNKHSFLLNREKRNKLESIDNNILFCLPPSIGLGDAIEYAGALKALKENNIIKNFAIAFTDKYSFIFENYFNLSILYPYVVSENIINQYNSLFHFTLEIVALKNQKNIRSNIEEEIKNYFNINSQKPKIKIKNNKKIKKISIFPISKSLNYF